MKRCDICDKETDYVSELSKEYQCYLVKDACHSCEKRIINASWKIRQILEEVKHREEIGYVRWLITKMKGERK